MSSLFGADLHGRILDSLVPSPLDTKGFWGTHRKAVKNDIRNLSLVSKGWKETVGTLMNQQVNKELGKQLMTPQVLAGLKYRVSGLDLSVISKNFVKDMKELWGNSGGHGSVSAQEIDILEEASFQCDWQGSWDWANCSFLDLYVFFEVNNGNDLAPITQWLVCIGFGMCVLDRDCSCC